MYFDDIPQNEDDRNLLLEFVRRIAWFLDDLARRPSTVLEGLDYRAPSLRETVLFAWEREVTPAMVQMVEGTGNISLANRQAAGLTGASLRAKLSIAAWWEARIPDLGRKAIAYILKLINSFLGSLAAALPLAEPVKEAKEMLENTLDLD